MRLASALALALAGLFATAQPSAAQTVAGLEFADWTSAGGSEARGTLLGHTVTLTGWRLSEVSGPYLDGTLTQFAAPYFTPPLPHSDGIEFRATEVEPHAYTLDLGAPTTDPLLHLASLGTTLEFPPGTSITRVSGKTDGFAVSGNVIRGAGDTTVDSYGNNDSNGTVRLNGTFRSITFTATTAYALDGILVQVGAPAALPTPTPTATPTPPPPGAGPENVSPPSIRAAGSGYMCDPGVWRNFAGAFAYRWLVFKPGGPGAEVLAETQAYTPGAAVYGYPVACEAIAGAVGAFSARAYFTSAGLNTLPPAYGDVRLRGIDVFQVTQPKAGARMYGYAPDTPFGTLVSGPCGGGTPTNWRRQGGSGILIAAGGCSLAGANPQVVNYEGVTLDRLKPTWAVVYVDVAGADAADPRLPYSLELSATSAFGAILGAPVVTTIINPPKSSTPWVQTYERDSTDRGAPGDRNRHGIPLRLPAAWFSGGGAITLQARVRFPDALAPGTAGFGVRECDSGDCAANDQFILRSVPFATLPDLRLRSVQLRTTGQAPLTAPETVLARARQLLPGGDRVVVSPYRGDIDISRALNLTATMVPGSNPPQFTCNGQTGPTITTRTCRIGFITQQIRTWIGTTPARPSRILRGTDRRQYDVFFGVHDYPTGNGTNEPGWAVGDIRTVGRATPAGANDTPLFTATATRRPLSAAAHELGHILTAPHTETNGCPNPATGTEPWPTDRQGRLQSVKWKPPFIGLGRTPGSGGATVDGDYPRADGTTFTGQLFDLMSYCADAADTATADGNQWVSARNWNRFTVELGALDRRLRAPALATTFRQTPSVSRVAVGAAGPDGGNIYRILPAQADALPAPAPGSPYVLRSLGDGGRVLLAATVRPQETSEGGAGTFAGPVADGASAVELLRDDVVLARLERSPAPHVRLLAPRRATRIGAYGALQVRWSASDPADGELSATIDFSADGGSSWRTVHDGGNDGHATVPAEFLSGSRNARIRVRVSDGFSETVVTSPRLAVHGAPPRVQIISPQPGATLRRGERVNLSGRATDDQDTPLSGRALTWFAGHRRLGAGADLTTRLPAGARLLRLVARDRNGSRTTATLRVSVTRPPLRLLELVVPARVARGTRTVRITVRASAPATFAAAGRRHRVRTRRTRLTIALPKRPVTGVVSVPFTLTSGAASRTLRGRLNTVRL